MLEKSLSQDSHLALEESESPATWLEFHLGTTLKHRRLLVCRRHLGWSALLYSHWQQQQLAAGCSFSAGASSTFNSWSLVIFSLSSLALWTILFSIFWGIASGLGHGCNNHWVSGQDTLGIAESGSLTRNYNLCEPSNSKVWIRWSAHHTRKSTCSAKC